MAADSSLLVSVSSAGTVYSREVQYIANAQMRTPFIALN